MRLAVLILLLVFIQSCTTNVVENGNDSATETQRETSELRSPPESYDIGDSLGLVSANYERYEQNGSIRIFNEDGSLWYELSSKDKNEEGVIISQKSEFMPFRIDADELLVVMNCVGEDDRYYHVIVNEDTKLKKYARKDDPILQLETWEKYILDCFAVGFDPQNNPIHDGPNGKPARSSDMPKTLNLRPEKISGEWLKVRWHENNDEKQPANFGWIKWKIDQKIVLTLFEIA